MLWSKSRPRSWSCNVVAWVVQEIKYYPWVGLVEKMTIDLICENR